MGSPQSLVSNVLWGGEGRKEMGAERACTFCFIEDVCTGSVLTNHILLSTSIIIKLTCAPSRVSSSSWGEVSTETKPMGKGRYLAEGSRTSHTSRHSRRPERWQMGQSPPGRQPQGRGASLLGNRNMNTPQGTARDQKHRRRC